MMLLYSLLHFDISAGKVLYICTLEKKGNIKCHIFEFNRWLFFNIVVRIMWVWHCVMILLTALLWARVTGLVVCCLISSWWWWWHTDRCQEVPSILNGRVSQPTCYGDQTQDYWNSSGSSSVFSAVNIWTNVYSFVAVDITLELQLSLLARILSCVCALMCEFDTDWLADCSSSLTFDWIIESQAFCRSSNESLMITLLARLMKVFWCVTSVSIVW